MYDITYEGSWHGNLALLPPLPPGVAPPAIPLSRWGIQRRRGEAEAGPLWQAEPGRRFSSFIVSDDVLLAAGHTGADAATSSFLTAIRMADGATLWHHPLPGPVVQGGTAVDRHGTVYVSLERGQLLAFGEPE